MTSFTSSEWEFIWTAINITSSCLGFVLLELRKKKGCFVLFVHFHFSHTKMHKLRTTSWTKGSRDNCTTIHVFADEASLERLRRMTHIFKLNGSSSFYSSSVAIKKRLIALWSWMEGSQGHSGCSVWVSPEESQATISIPLYNSRRHETTNNGTTAHHL